MKYFMVRFIVSSGKTPWNFIALSDTSSSDDAVDIVLEDNSWIHVQESYTTEVTEITEEQFKAGEQAMSYFERDMKMLQENVFPVKEWAILLADSKKPVRIGYPNNHMVYRMSEDRVLSYQYDYSSSKFGVLKQFEKAYPV